MSNYSIIHQQIQRTQKEISKSMDELKAIEQKKEKEESKKEYEKDLQIALKQDLSQFFYEHFENMQKQGFELDKIYNNLLLLENRNEIIKTKASNSFECDFLNSIYKKTLKELYQIFKDDEEAQKAIKPPTPINWEDIDIKCNTAINNALNTIYNGKENSFTNPKEDITEKKIKKNGFILLLNMIFGKK